MTGDRTRATLFAVMGATEQRVAMPERRLARLTAADLSYLRYETPAAPMQIGALVIVEAAPLLDPDGRLQLDEIRRRIELRLSNVPVLRRRLFTPGLFQGRPLWVDDESFDISNHVREIRLTDPGGEADLLEVAGRLMSVLLDRSRPLWELWFITGVRAGRVGLLVKLHHAIADGRATVAMLSALFDLSHAGAPDPDTAVWVAASALSSRTLFADNVSARIDGARRAARSLVHPLRAAATGWQIGSALLTGARGAAAPQSSINRPVAPGRRVRFARFELAALKDAAHASGGKVNDVVLDLAAGALRELLLGRGEPVDGVELVASIPVSLRSAEQASGLGNAVGVIVVQLPVGRMDAHRRLSAIVGSTTQAKREQHPAQIAAFVAWIAARPIAQRFISRQRLINVEVTNVAGPPAPVYVLGARVLEVVPITPAVGNVTISFCAFSYTGRLYLVATADAHACPDIDRLIAGAQKEWDELHAGQRREGCRREPVA